MTDEHDDLDRLFAAYREACPAPEPGPDFMPGVWRKIDARRRLTLLIPRWAAGFVAAAAALCILMGGYLLLPRPAESPVYTTTYLDTLEDSPALETLAYMEVVSFETSESQ
ncbi:MAG TPA: hypothetical protein ENJ62_07150 [Bryobacterales bacterium]|nr:hypothetical protein [Bryobacterales bacterium]